MVHDPDGGVRAACAAMLCAALTLTAGGPAAADGNWGRATLASLAKAGAFNEVNVKDVSCASAGNCTAVGTIDSNIDDQVPFTMSSVNGTWGSVTPVVIPPGMQRPGKPAAFLDGVSCASAGNCTAVGALWNPDDAGLIGGSWYAFTITSTDGEWGKVTQVAFAPGAQPDGWRDARLHSVSCASPGNCTAMGIFMHTNRRTWPFVVSSTNGVWGKATSVGLPTLLAQAQEEYTERPQVQCASAGNCTAIGTIRFSYDVRPEDTFGFGYGQNLFAVSSVEGVWGRAVPLMIESGHQDVLGFDMSCASALNCTVVGYMRRYAPDESGTLLTGGAFTISSANGAWSRGSLIDFSTKTHYDGTLTAVSCASAGDCTAVGGFIESAGDSSDVILRAVTMSSAKGSWGQPTLVDSGICDRSPQPKDLYKRGCDLLDVACASAGNCVVGGLAYDGACCHGALTLTSTNGMWGRPTSLVFDSAAESVRQTAAVRFVQCPAAGSCVAIGQFVTDSKARIPFMAASSIGDASATQAAVFSIGGTRKGSAVTFFGTAPARANLAKVYVQRRSGTRWVDVGTAMVRNGRWTVVVNPAPSATFRARIGNLVSSYLRK